MPLAFLEGYFCSLHSVRVAVSSKILVEPILGPPEVAGINLGRGSNSRPTLSLQYLNFHAWHEVAICIIHTPCKIMTINDVIV